MVNDSPPEWSGQSHFFAVASRVMRQILVDHSRRHQAGKRGGGAIPAELDEAMIPAETAEALGVAGITVMREMRLAEAWLASLQRPDPRCQADLIPLDGYLIKRRRVAS